jgi:gliding motility-associated-like protein
MKNNLQKCKFLLAFLLMTSFSQLANAQLVGTEVFLQGQYVEVGVATNGAFGTDNAAPAGYHARGVAVGSGFALGFVADPDKDGWTVGTPNYIGDYFLPGSPQEGWDIQYNGIWAKAWRGGGGTSFTGGLTGACTGYSVVGTKRIATWEGSTGPLAIRQITTLRTDKVYFVSKVTIKNTSSTTVNNIYYERTVDPDNEVAVPGGGSYVTINKIEYYLPNATKRSLVSATGQAFGAYLGLGTKDCRAKPYIVKGSLTPLDSLSVMFNDTASETANTIFRFNQPDTADINDEGIGVIFNIGSLAPGDSTNVSYAYVLSKADLDSAFADVSPVWNYDGKQYESGDTVKVCRIKGSADENKILNIDGGSGYSWIWSPRPGLKNLTGTDNQIVLTDATVTYVAKPSEAFGCIDSMVITIQPFISPDAPTTSGPLYYCQHDVAPALTATYSSVGSLRWYTVATGGVGTATLVPPTNVVGTRTYYVSVLNGVCESARTPIQVITRSLPTLSLLGHTDPTYCAALDGTITIKVDSGNAVYTVGYDKNGVPQSSSYTSDPSGTLVITGLSGGKYTALYVINKYGCKSNPFYGPVTLIDPAGSGPALTNNGPVCEGSIAILKAGAISGPGTLSYSWSGPGGFSSTLANPSFIASLSSAGTYTLVVTKGSCILSPTSTTLEVKAGPQHQNFTAQSLCENSNLHLGTLLEVGTTYQWTGPGFSSLKPDLNISNIQTSQSGTYTLLSTSSYGCSTIDTVKIQVDKNITITYGADTSICVNDSALLYITTDAPSVGWTPTDGLDNPSTINPKASPSQTTIYTVTGYSNSTCPNKTGTVTVTVVQPPSVVGYDTLVRMNVPYTLMPLYGQSAVKWQWVPSDSLSCNNCPTPVFNSNKDMQYLVYATNALGCSSFDTVTVRVFCDGASITMPNAFTPNGDNHNDIYYVRGNGFIVKKFAIYNRLGQEVFSKTNFAPNDPQYGWDGTFQGAPISDAAGFVYMLEVQCYNSNNEPFITKGTVLMIK